ncbi:Uncharacterized protein BP5553_02267 [Venustampulla echinocandica]|uniref:Ubiquitin-like domain-containing protein n=1 Tax=Venustampulla echinocandica TaxID=2656787 RepID=A0A370U3D5_9HELO|nr:Uncharacterized protein BP5553_02267 [Venustampulla echinocandica]RDL42288.1 Uncharacterized protein BP5553_02267 [Venustampulla echinocandica]
MGCCQSRSLYPPSEQPNSSSRAITSSQPQLPPALPRPSTSTHSGRHSHHRSSQPLSAHINRPLRPHVWSSRSRVWTRAELDRERTEFFETRVAGRPEIWQTLRVALEVLWAGGDPEDDTGILTAQTILDAAGITLPTGDLAGGAYDGFGAFYPLHQFVVSDPENMVDSPSGAAPAGDGEDKDAESDELDEDEILRRREEKGKAVVNPKDLMNVRARLSDGAGPDLVVSVGKEDSVRLLTRRVFEESGLTQPKYIRIAYMGRILKDNQSLIAQGWKDDHVVNALVFG